MGIAEDAVILILDLPVFVMLTIMSSSVSSVAGTKLRISHFNPSAAFSRMTLCQSMPASSVTFSASLRENLLAFWMADTPVSDQTCLWAPRPSTRTQKLRLDFVLLKSSTETGKGKKE